MNLGTNEKIVFSLMKKYPQVSKNGLKLLFKIVTNKTVRIDPIINSLITKNIINKKTKRLIFSGIKNVELPDLEVDEIFLDNLKYLEEPLNLGKFAKSVLYLLDKTQKASLQFIVKFFGKSEENVYAILIRLERKNLVLSYKSRIQHSNSIGRRYRPKYYVLTDLGRLWIKIYHSEIDDQKQIDSIIEEPQQEIHNMISKFDNNKT